MNTRAVMQSTPPIYPLHRIDRSPCLENPRPQGGISLLRELHNLHLHAEPKHSLVIHDVAAPPNGHRESRSEIELATRRAHQLRMKVMLKPHHRPGVRDLASIETRAAWFRKHGDGMEEIGRFASSIHIDLLCVGYEMGKAFVYDREWREVIRRVRRVYDGPLTVCPSQGDEFEGITFWDAVRS